MPIQAIVGGDARVPVGVEIEELGNQRLPASAASGNEEPTIRERRHLAAIMDVGHRVRGTPLVGDWVVDFAERLIAVTRGIATGG
jgi:hypothetical protein